MDANRKRTELMLVECGRVSECLQKKGIRHAVLKGITLVPDFSPALGLRHQSDIDFLIPAESIGQARAAIFECGYLFERNPMSGEFNFSAPLTRLPSVADDIYQTDYHKQVELHTSIWDDMDCVCLEPPGDCIGRARMREIGGLTLPTLASPDAFLMQTLHAFRHFLSSWTRVSWLWEIHYCVITQNANTATWAAIAQRGGDDPVMKNAVGLVLRVTNQVFGTPLPQALREWCIETLPEPIECWAAHFGTRWALCGMSGSKLTLLIHKQFIRNPKLWKPYVWKRMIPLRSKRSLGKIDSAHVALRVRFMLGKGASQARRLAFHAGTLISLPLEVSRWQYALYRARSRGRALMTERALRREM